MKKSSMLSKITFDMLYQKGNWALGFLLVLLLLHVGMGIGTSIGLNVRSEFAEEDFLSLAFRSSKGFLLVIGILSAYGFLSYYVKMGLTRKDFYYGAVLSTGILSLLFPLVAGTIQLVLGLFMNGSINSAILQEFNNNWLHFVTAYSIQNFFFYLMGWLIGTGFYRYDWIRGIGFIAIAVVGIAVIDGLWQYELESFWGNWLPITFGEMPFLATLAVSLAVIVVALILIRFMSRKITIRM
ncbi:hypothetical protein JCM10914A_32210 [Paenibacillus sp. JCM 10914]|uniref:hypothetical protein n=1 Tax=Paenibacillus sp. JCM 10914 TaxID=1236974 RepID=UPI0003CCA069|nr:hypothetical protein [Paenibacillus sp. JCM 10914]GAE07795.1 hypothetical protein JCM10914_4040 [Paenibacillus sp. JCM 10914]